MASSHEPQRAYRRIREATNRSFGFVMAAFFSLVGLVPLLRGREPRIWALAAALAFTLAAALAPASLAPLNRAWLNLGYLLQRVVSPIVMAVLYFGLFFPLGLLARISGKDLLARRLRRGPGSYWIPRPPGEGWPGDMRRSF